MLGYLVQQRHGLQGTSVDTDRVYLITWANFFPLITMWVGTHHKYQPSSTKVTYRTVTHGADILAETKKLFCWLCIIWIHGNILNDVSFNKRKILIILKTLKYLWQVKTVKGKALLHHIIEVQQTRYVIAICLTGSEATCCHLNFKIVNIKSTNTCQETWVYLLEAEVCVSTINKMASRTAIMGVANTCINVI